MSSKKQTIEDLVGKEIYVDKDEFYIKLFDYDSDGSLSRYFSDKFRFYETKNIAIDCFYKHTSADELTFYIKPRRKRKIGFMYRGRI